MKKILNDIKNGTQPNEDFYNYVDELWRKNVNLSKDEKYIAEVDDFRLVQNKVGNVQ